MTLHEIQRRTGISLAKLRKLEKLQIDFGKIDPPEENPADAIRFHLMRNQQMTAAQLLALLDAPDMVDDLGRYKERALAQVASIGDVAADAAPRDVTAAIRDAGKGDDDAALVVAQWLLSILPPYPVSHHWVAVRLLLPLNEFQRAQAMPMISLALLNVRKLPEFAAAWQSVKRDKKNKIEYFRPEAKKELASLDL